MTTDPTATVARLFAAVAARDLPAILSCYAPDVTIREAESLPYGGTYHGREGAHAHAVAFWETWGRFQPATVDDLGEVLVADPAGHVAVCWRHRARDGERWLDAPAVSVYEVRDGLVAQSTMFHLDTTALLEFLGAARCRPPAPVEPRTY